MKSLFRTGMAGAALACLTAAVAAPAAFHDPLDTPATPSAIATRSPLLAATRTPGGRLVALGRRGLILTSDDGGASWRQARVPVSTDLVALSFPTDRDGWAVGHAGVVLHTADGGLSWERQLDGRVLPGLLIAHSTPGAAAGDERARRDLEEAQRFKEDGPGRPLLDVLFTDARHGMVVGAFNLALTTADGGRSWQPVGDLLDNPQGMHLYSLARIGGKLWIAGEQGLLLRQDQDGHFRRLPVPYSGTLFGVTGHDATVFVYGLRGHALRSTDGGASWIELRTGTQSNLVGGALMADGALALASLGGELLYSADDGRSFRAVRPADPMALYGVLATGPGALLLTGARGLRMQALGMASATGGRP